MLAAAAAACVQETLQRIWGRVQLQYPQVKHQEGSQLPSLLPLNTVLLSIPVKTEKGRERERDHELDPFFISPPPLSCSIYI